MVANKRSRVLKTILFDLDGTLIDSTEAIVESFFRAFDALHVKRASKSDICSFVGHPLDIMFQKLGVQKGQIEEIISHYKNHYRKVSTQKTHLLPQAKKSVLAAKELGKLGVVTTKTAKYSKELLEHFDMLKHFEVVIGREDVQNPKPHKEPILKALNALHVSPSKEVFMIGDTCLDMNAAKNAQVVGIGVLCGYGTKEDLSKCTTHLAQNSLEAIEYIKK